MEPLKQQKTLHPYFKKSLKHILDKKWMILGLLGLGVVFALIITLILPKQYRASSVISFKYNSVNNSLLNNNGSLESEINYLKSKQVLSNTVEKLSKINIEVSVSDLLNMITLFEDNASTSVIVTSVAGDARIAAGAANALVASFSEYSKLNSKYPYLHTLKILNNRLKEIQGLNSTLQTAQQSSFGTNLNVNQERIITRLTEFESELENIEIDYQFHTAQMQYLQKILEDNYPIISQQILNITDAKTADYILKIERLEARKNLAGVLHKLRNFTIRYPWSENFRIEDLPKFKSEFNKNLIQLIDGLAKENSPNNDVNFLKRLAAKLYTSQMTVNSIDLSKSIIFNIMTDLEGQFNQIPFANLDNARQVRSARFKNKLLIKLKSKELKLKEKQKEFIAEIDSIIKAELPDSFFSPNIPLNLFLGGLIGLLIGVILAVTSKRAKLEFITSIEDLEDAGYKIISQIPTFAPDTPMLLDMFDNNGKKNLNPDIIKSFEGIETFLKYGNLDKSLRTILVTSGYENEGKSIIASNIAIALAKQDNKVLLVDADLKKPCLNKYFKVKSTPSLAHYLFRKKELRDIIRSTHCKELDLITCIEFPQNPAVIIASERMKNFMKEVKTDYDYVVYDTSSLSQLKETAGIAKRVDEVILVVRANKTKFSELSNAEQLLQEGGVLNFNVVLNDVNN